MVTCWPNQRIALCCYPDTRARRQHARSHTHIRRSRGSRHGLHFRLAQDVEVLHTLHQWSAVAQPKGIPGHHPSRHRNHHWQA